MGFMKSGSDIQNMSYIGELSMGYLGMVRAVPLPFSPQSRTFEAKPTTLTLSSGWPNAMACKAPQYESLSSQSG